MPTERRLRHGPARVSKEAYPTPHATGRFTRLRNPHGARLPKTEAELHGVNCAQCNFPLSDWRIHKSCPHCESDNFLGQKLKSER